MSNAIQFLETLGASPASSSRDTDAYAQALAAVDIDEAQHRALIGRDAGALARILDGRSQMLCMIVTPDGGEEQEEEPDQTEEEDDEPAERGDEQSAAGHPV